jgi:hypothetical protein
VFTKAFALVARNRPELRRSYLAFPWPHLYEHAANVATVTVERRYGEEDAVFFVPIQKPELAPLAQIDARLRRCKRDPLHSIGAFRRFLVIGKLPRPLRRLLWWTALHCLGRKRANLLGTYGVTVYSGLGAASLHPLSVLTSTLNYGVIEPDGSVDVRLIYDHRVLDGATVARALAEVETVLNGPIVDELTGLPGPGPAGVPAAVGTVLP